MDYPIMMAFFQMYVDRAYRIIVHNNYYCFDGGLAKVDEFYTPD